MFIFPLREDFKNQNIIKSNCIFVKNHQFKLFLLYHYLGRETFARKKRLPVLTNPYQSSQTLINPHKPIPTLSDPLQTLPINSYQPSLTHLAHFQSGKKAGWGRIRKGPGKDRACPRSLTILIWSEVTRQEVNCYITALQIQRNREQRSFDCLKIKTFLLCLPHFTGNNVLLYLFFLWRRCMADTEMITIT